ncbi:MAG: alpha/beta hydrolase [Pseudomonadota bacterium]
MNPKSVSFQKLRIDLPHGHLAVHRSGGIKPAMLILHGLGDSGLCWQAVARSFTADYDVVLLDGRGHGESSMPPEGANDDPVADLGALLDRLALEQVTLMGHSIGALAALSFAAAQNQRVVKLVLEDPPLRDKPFQPTAAMVNGFAQQMNELRQLTLAQVVAVGRQQHPGWPEEEFAPWAKAKQQVNPDILACYQFPPWPEVVGSISVPTLLIHGAPGSDSAVPPERAEAIVALNTQFRSVAVPGAGHNVRRENPAAFIRAVQGFLKG